MCRDALALDIDCAVLRVCIISGNFRLPGIYLLMEGVMEFSKDFVTHFFGLLKRLMDTRTKCDNAYQPPLL
jgi:hypothetical protein